MEASEAVQPAAPAANDVSEVHRLLDEAEKLFHERFGHHGPGDVADDVVRLTPTLNTVRMVVDQTADLASKAEEAN